MTGELRLERCSDHREHICQSGAFLLHHSPLNEPFSDMTTEHGVGECDDCAEWDSTRDGQKESDRG